MSGALPAGSDPQTFAWPKAPEAGWLETCATIQMWAQIVGKIRMAHAPMLNHWWQATLYVTARGLTTSLVHTGATAFQIDFDFVRHRLIVLTGRGGEAEIALAARPVAEFYAELMARLAELGIATPIWPVPVEVAEPIPFAEDTKHQAYDPAVAESFGRILGDAERVLQDFRSPFLGKSSPVHFFWGSFDLALTRFSGRRAPVHPGGIPHLPDRVTREAYSHEVISFGFWPGTRGGYERPAFYAYAYPQPDGLEAARIRPPEEASWNATMREFLLPYDAVQRSSDPDRKLRAFLDSTYAAAADLGGWDRMMLERQRAAE